MAPDGCGGIKRSSTYMKSRNMLKKGPWTASEDMLLVEYVKKHGEGNWNALQRNSGLMRCGKSCRLRWANHLRPNLKKGAFTVEEEELIIELHAKLGNKWARMAAQLPGRTDNEIKNYWNTRLKRCHRAGLPIYPQEVNQEQNQQYRSSIQPGLSSLLTSSHLPNPNSNPNPLYYFSSSLTMNPPPHQPNSSYITQELKLFNDNNSCLALSLNPMPFYNQRLSISPFYNSINFGINSELPSIQSAASSTEFVMEKQSDDAEDYEVSPRLSHHSNSGLLEDLLGESQALSGRIKAEVSFIAAAENEHEKIAFSFGHVNETSESQFQGKTQKELREENNSGDDDLMNLLDNFPLAVPFPDWTEGHGYESPNLTNGTNGTMECQTEDSQYTPVATSSGAENRDGNFGPCWWNNMPTIY